MAEQARIAQLFAPLSVGVSGSFSLTDDAAVLDVPPGKQLVITTDSVIEGIHVMNTASPEQFAQKLVRRNLSDLAAMGATPWRYFLNLHSSGFVRKEWVAVFARTLAEEQALFDMALAGGDSSSGGDRVHTTMTCLGLLEGPPLLRSTARVGDAVFVSGTIGDAALGLRILQHQLHAPAVEAHLLMRYHRPEPRLALGQQLIGLATSCIDISDGLLGDAQHIAQASGVGLALETTAIPLSDAARQVVTDQPDLFLTLLGGGDDYELLFTAPPTMQTRLATLSEALALPLTRIGTVVVGNGLTLDGKPITPRGYEHA